MSRSPNPTGVVKTIIVGHWVLASGTLRATSRPTEKFLGDPVRKVYKMSPATTTDELVKQLKRAWRNIQPCAGVENLVAGMP